MLNTRDVFKEAQLAESRIRPYIRETYLETSLYFSRLTGANVYCKLENLQYTGSFKPRGAFNKALSISVRELERGVVTASTGNHGMGMAFCLTKLHASGTIFVTENAALNKIEAIKALGIEVRLHGTDVIETEKSARQFAAEQNMTYLPPYNDLQVIGGQGTIGIELTRQLDRIDAVFVPLGGGGLISGIAGYVKSVSPKTQIIGCSPEHSQVMIQSVKAGKILDLPSLPTLSDATAGGIEAESITFDMCRAFVDDYVAVTEEEIKQSLRLFIAHHHVLIEGAAGVAIASFLKMRERFQGKNVVLIICGANISLDTLKSIL